MGVVFMKKPERMREKFASALLVALAFLQIISTTFFQR
jgi:hypothetical protein